MKQTILVTGGAGYIGSHTVLELLHQNHTVVVIDKVCSFQINHPNVTYFQCDIADTPILKTICARYTIDAVIHCAAFIEVGASVVNPAAYYENNVIKTVIFLETMRACSITTIIFSSSAAVYGTPHTLPIPETHSCNPISPYGKTKLIIEQVLEDYRVAYSFKYRALRYFNACGAYPEYHLGERHEPETHLIPRMLQAVIDNAPFTLYGDDYETPDGTCVRDYVHVRDIARAHRLALEHLQETGKSGVTNLGTTHGYSVKEIIQAVEQVTQKKVIIQKMGRRAGDPAYLIADTTQAKNLLNWQPQYSDIRLIVSSAYTFMQQQSIDINRSMCSTTNTYQLG